MKGDSVGADAEKQPDGARRLAAVLAEFRRVERAQRTHLRRMREADLRLLWLLRDDRPRTLREIAQEMGLEQSTINRQVNAAFDAGWLERSRPAGQVAHVFTATKAGRDAFDETVSQNLSDYRAALAELGDDADRFLAQFEQFMAALHDIQAAHETRRR